MHLGESTVTMTRTSLSLLEVAKPSKSPLRRAFARHLLEAACPSQNVPCKSELFGLKAAQLSLLAKFWNRRSRLVKDFLNEDVKFFLATDFFDNRCFLAHAGGCLSGVALHSCSFVQLYICCS